MSILVGATSGLAGAAGAAGGADLGDTIDQSLRFRGSNQFLRRNAGFGSGNANAYTFSTWVKLGEVPHSSGDYHLISNAHSSHTSSAFIEYIAHTSDSIFRIFYFFGSVQYDIKSLGKYRDPSAWYHVVFAVDTNQGTASDRAKIYVNGVDVTDTSNSTFPGSGAGVLLTSGNEITVGSESVRDRFDLDGYLAETHFVDGSQLTADDFGRTNEDGIWVPDTYTGTHGTNGFHFTYSDSSDLGSDSSASNNDFTASGFDTGDVVLYSKDLTGSGSTYESDTANRTQALVDPFRAFDTDSANGVRNTASGGGFVYFNPETALTGVTGVRILFTSQTVGEARINGSTVTTTTSGNYQVLTLPSSPMTVNEIAIRRNQASTEVINYEIDQGSGFVQLVDNTDNDVDFLDTPTSNYATLNPLFPDQASTNDATYAKANLQQSGGASPTIATISLPQSNTYWEVTTSSTNGAYGVGNTSAPYSDEGIALFASGSSSALGGVSISSGSWSGYSSGDILAFAWDGSEVDVYVNNTFQLTASGFSSGGTFFPYSEPSSGTGTTTFDVNYGQMPFIYTPPTGYTGLQTNNLPEPTIKNGREHFDVITYTGTKVQRNVTGLEFQPDLVWVKGRDNSTNHVLVDSVRGATEVLESDSAAIENTIAQSVNAFNSDGFAVGTDNDVNNNSVGNNSYVAWCWKAGGTAGLNEAGSIDSQVSANTDAGFSIVSYTGTGANATVGHGLTEAPEFVIVKNRESSANFWIVGTEAHGFDKILFLNTNAEAEPSSNVYFSSSPSNTVVNLGTSGNTNRLDFDFIMYAWHSVEGFSKFSKYTGNGSTDGVFVYLGFKPALLVIRSLAGRPWMVYDSVRNTSNPLDNRLYWDQSSEENASDSGTSNILDFLSNGFKLRDNSGQTNASGEEYVFMAWAENPFGGENAPPATAR